MRKQLCRRRFDPLAGAFASASASASAYAGLLVVALAVGAVGTSQAQTTTAFPRPERPVASVVSPTWDTEAARDRVGEAERVFDYLRIMPGMRVADLGAGSGYYTMRLARRLGPSATIVAEDVDPGYLANLQDRLDRAGALNVRTVLGTPGDPTLPPASVDVAILAHMYHEIENPYEFLYNLHGALAPGARVGIVDLDRPIESHGTPSRLLRCELAALGYRMTDFYLLTPASGYLAVFVPPDSLPAVSAIRPCRADDMR